jgi:hypothetical protein
VRAAIGRYGVAALRIESYAYGVTREKDLVQLFAVRGRELEAMRGLAGGVTATHLRTATLSKASFDALVQGLADRQPKIRWWCIQLLDHVADDRALSAIVSALDDPVPRVRRNAAHAFGCVACKPRWDRRLPSGALDRLSALAADDPNQKVRREAATALACMT